MLQLKSGNQRHLGHLGRGCIFSNSVQTEQRINLKEREREREREREKEREGERER